MRRPAPVSVFTIETIRFTASAISRAHRRLADFGDQLLDPLEAGAGMVGMDGTDPAGMTGVPGFQEGEGLAAADLADNDPVRPKPHCRLQQPLHVDRVGRPHHHGVLRGALQLTGILDDDDAMLGCGPHHVVDDGIRERRFAGTGAADHEDVVTLRDG